MWSREKRISALALAVSGAAFGVVMEFAMDPFEGAGLAWVGLVLGALPFAGVVSHWYDQRLDAAGEVDERQQAIERRASSLNHGTLTVGVAAVALVLTVPAVDLPVATLLWALLVGSVAVHELSIEYYRRWM